VIQAGLFLGSSRNPGKHRNKNADLIDDVRASKHI
jgi:transposase